MHFPTIGEGWDSNSQLVDYARTLPRSFEGYCLLLGWLAEDTIEAFAYRLLARPDRKQLRWIRHPLDLWRRYLHRGRGRFPEHIDRLHLRDIDRLYRSAVRVWEDWFGSEKHLAISSGEARRPRGLVSRQVEAAEAQGIEEETDAALATPPGRLVEELLWTTETIVRDGGPNGWDTYVAGRRFGNLLCREERAWGQDPELLAQGGRWAEWFRSIELRGNAIPDLSSPVEAGDDTQADYPASASRLLDAFDIVLQHYEGGPRLRVQLREDGVTAEFMGQPVPPTKSPLMPWRIVHCLATAGRRGLRCDEVAGCAGMAAGESWKGKDESKLHRAQTDGIAQHLSHLRRSLRDATGGQPDPETERWVGLLGKYDGDAKRFYLGVPRGDVQFG